MHRISEEELVEKLKFVAKGEPKCNPTYRMPIPEAMLSKEIKESKGAKESKKEHILEEIRKALGEGLIAVLDSLNHNDSSQSSIWELSDDDKTAIDDDSNKGDNDDEFGKDSDAGDDHTTSFRILTLTVVPLLDIIPEVQEEAPIDQAIDYPPATTTITPPTKSKKKRAKILLKKVIRQKNDSKKSIMQKIGEHEQKLNALVQINHAEAIKDSVQVNVINKVKNQLPKYVPKAVSDYVQPRLERTVLDDPPKNHEGETKKRRRKSARESSSKKEKALVDTSTNFERFEDVDEPTQEEEFYHDAFNVEHSYWFKQPGEHELKIGSTVMFAKSMKNLLNKDKITKSDLEDPAFELLKNRFKNNIELEYNIEQCYLGMTNIIDWANPEGNRFHTYLRKSLPLEGPPSRKTIPTRYFFNNDLEYLKHGNQEKKYALSVTKIKVSRYEQEGIEEMIPRIWSPSIHKYDINAKLGIHHLRDNRQWFYKGNIRHRSAHDEIMVKRADQKKYKFAEDDFPRLNQNDIEDLIMIKKRVEDAQSGGESYQTKLNLTKPQFMTGYLHQKVSYTTMSHPRGVVYLGNDKKKMIMRADEIHKFSDGTLNKVYNKLDVILRDNILGYGNDGMKDLKWTKKDKERTKLILETIEKTLKERRGM
ncbi:hypothetical protein Tco_0814547 [Tanacetum coccineum]